MKPSPDDTGRLKAFTGRGERRRFGRYETLFRIASGGMAEVYASRILGEGGFEKIVALKRMLPTLAEDERFVSMFLDEGRVAAHISSPNVVQTLDLGRADDDSLYLVMELVVGVPLGQLIRGVLRNGKLVALDIAVEIIAQAATGLHDAHNATTATGEPLKLIHRDISPQNILVDRVGRTRITDFGVARAMQSHSQTQTGEVKGKMSYFAPEQALNGNLTSRLDIFALGIVAWELITGRRLFKADHPVETLRKVLEEPIPSVHEHRDNVPEALGTCIAKALERDPDERFQTAREFAQALRAAYPPARPAAVGEYVKLHGAKSIEPLEKGLKQALSDKPAPAVVELPPDADISTSAIVRSGTYGSESRTLTLHEEDEAGPQVAEGGSRRGLLAFLSLAMLGVTLAVFFAVRPSATSEARESDARSTRFASPVPPSGRTDGAERTTPLPQPIEVPAVEVQEPPNEEEAPETESVESEPARPVSMRGRGRGRGMRGARAQRNEPPAAGMDSPSEAPQSAMSASMAGATSEMATDGAAPTMEETSGGGSEMSGSSMGLLMQWGDP